MAWYAFSKGKKKENDPKEKNKNVGKVILTKDDNIEYIIVDKNEGTDEEVKPEEVTEEGGKSAEKVEDTSEKVEESAEKIEDSSEDIEKLSKESENLDKENEKVEQSEEALEEDLVGKATETDPVDKVEDEEKEEVEKSKEKAETEEAKSETEESKTEEFETEESKEEAQKAEAEEIKSEAAEEEEKAETEESEEVKSTETKKEASKESSEEASESKSSSDDEKLTSNKEVLEKLDLLNEYFKQKLLYDKHKDTIIDNLHKEVQDHRNDLHLKIIKPLLMSIIQVKDSIERSERIHREKNVEELDANKLLNLLASFAEELGDILDMYNVVQYKEEGNSFKAIRQKIIKMEKTEDDSLDKTIKESLSYGYELDGKVISPEKIVVYKKA